MGSLHLQIQQLNWRSLGCGMRAAESCGCHFAVLGLARLIQLSLTPGSSFFLVQPAAQQVPWFYWLRGSTDDCVSSARAAQDANPRVGLLRSALLSARELQQLPKQLQDSLLQTQSNWMSQAGLTEQARWPGEVWSSWGVLGNPAENTCGCSLLNEQTNMTQLSTKAGKKNRMRAFSWREEQGQQQLVIRAKSTSPWNYDYR